MEDRNYLLLVFLGTAFGLEYYVGGSRWWLVTALGCFAGTLIWRFW